VYGFLASKYTKILRHEHIRERGLVSVYRRGGVYWYDFWWRGHRHRASTHQTLKEDAQFVESQRKLALRREAGGIAILDAKASPRIAEWAGVVTHGDVTFNVSMSFFPRVEKTIKRHHIASRDTVARKGGGASGSAAFLVESASEQPAQRAP